MNESLYILAWPSEPIHLPEGAYRMTCGQWRKVGNHFELPISVQVPTPEALGLRAVKITGIGS